MDIWKIYKHTNKINGKCYIGQTCRKNPNERWNNGKGYNKAVFAKAIEKYGWENFEHEIIEDGIMSEEEANKREIYWIKYYNAYAGNPNGGYNMTRGGDDRADKGRPVYQIDIKTLKIINCFSSALKAQRETGATCVSACCNPNKPNQITTANSYWCYVDEYSDDWKPKNGKFICVNNNGSKTYNYGDNQICQIDENGNLVNIFNNVKEASVALGGKKNSHSRISECCQGKAISAKGYFWCYKKDLENFEIPIKMKPKTLRRVRCVELDREFDGVRIASRELGVHHRGIIRCCNKETYTAGGYHWEYVDNKERKDG